MQTRAITFIGAAIAAAVSLGAASSASAAIEFCTANGDGPCSIDGENVHFDGDDGLDNIVFGDLQSGGVDVIFTGTENITTSAQGNGTAWVVPVDGLFNSVDVSLGGGYSFTSILFRLDAPQTQGQPQPWSITLHGYDATNTAFTQAYSGITGDQRFSIVATGGDRLSHIDFTTGSPVTAMAQIKIGGVAAVTVVPEPATWALMIGGFGGAGAMLRRRRRAAVAA